MKDFKVGCSPLTSKIYAGYVNKDGKTWAPDKHEVTNSAVDAVACYLIQTDQFIEFDYEGKKYRMLLEEIK